MARGVLDKAKRQKADEFYTQLSDIEKELKNYKEQFKGKTIFCNCDDPESSNFYYYFVSGFEELKLKKLITTHFKIDKPSYKIEYEGGADVRGDKEIVVKRAIKASKKTALHQNFEQGTQGALFEDEPDRSYSGDFRSPECIELLKQSDIVVTNPPFSLFREYVAQLIEYDKKFLIIGNMNAITYKEIFTLIKENKLWLGYGFNGGNAYFKTPLYREFAEGVYNPETGLVKFRNVHWFTNLKVLKRNEKFVLYKTYKGHEDEYPKYDNYDAIEVSRVQNIPIDYDGVMGVPITFLDKYNPSQFDIVRFRKGDDGKDLTYSNKNDIIVNTTQHNTTLLQNSYSASSDKAELTSCLKNQDPISMEGDCMQDFLSNEFEIIDGLNRYSILDVVGTNEWARKNHLHMTSINGKSTYFRVLIKRRINDYRTS